MEYRIEHKESRKFLALVRAFPAEIIEDDDDHSVKDFWDESYEKDRIECMKVLRPAGKRDIYGLCSPAPEGAAHFSYGIGVLLDGETDAAGADALLACGYSVWDATPADYAVFKCMGTDGDCIAKAWGDFFEKFLPQTGYRSTEDTDYEFYPEQGEAGLFCELWVPVKKA